MDSAVARASRIETDPVPWASGVGQLGKFAFAVIRSGAKGADIYRAYQLATERYPQSAVAWFQLGRAYQFGQRPRDAAVAFRRAHELRPAQDLIARMYAASTRQK
jgi:hypothetical protein